MDVDAARALLAGFLSGVAGGLAATPVALLAIVRDPSWRERLPKGVSPAAIGIVAANGMLLVWSLAGLLLAALYLAVGQPRYSVAVSLAIAALIAGTLVVRRRLPAAAWLAGAIAAIVFAVMLPALAGSGSGG